MTNHYNIEVLETKTHFKATYRDNKFRKLEHLRGKITIPMLKAVGRIVPLFENAFKDYTTVFKGKVNYTLIENKKTLFSEFNDAWFSFYETYAGFPPKFTGADAKSLKYIISYLTKLSTNETEALELWKLILNKWHTLNDFHKDNTDLKYINSKLNIILNAIKQKNSSYSTGTSGSVEL